jgi:hypothetical protein
VHQDAPSPLVAKTHKFGIKVAMTLANFIYLAPFGPVWQI